MLILCLSDHSCSQTYKTKDPVILVAITEEVEYFLAFLEEIPIINELLTKISH